MSSFKGKVIVISGAASGIGRSIAKLLARHGALLSLSDVNSAGLDSVKEEIQNAKHASENDINDSNGNVSDQTEDAFDPIYTSVVDVRSQEACHAWLRNTFSYFGGRPIAGAANMAGVTNIPGGKGPGAGRDSTDDEWNFVLDVNLKGTVNSLRAELPYLQQGVSGRGGGAVVNAASISGLMGLPGYLPYSSSKHAVIGVTRTVAKEEGSKGIRVNAIAPAFIDTPMLDQVAEARGTSSSMDMFGGGPSPALGRLGDAEEVAELVVFLLSPRSGFITGAVINIDGGLLC